MSRTYEELSRLESFGDRLEYLRNGSNVAEETFGDLRALNQRFYKSPEWRRVRDAVILRDNGCDLGVSGLPIKGKVIIHHIEPIDSSDISEYTGSLIDPNNLICVSHATHNMIHYGISDISNERSKDDTKLW